MEFLTAFVFKNDFPVKQTTEEVMASLNMLRTMGDLAAKKIENH